MITQKDYNPRPMPDGYEKSALDSEFQAISSRHKKIYQDLLSGKTGVLILDDGANWRVTFTFKEGKLKDIATAASIAATASWT